jgi:hypothetical protein
MRKLILAMGLAFLGAGQLCAAAVPNTKGVQPQSVPTRSEDDRRGTEEHPLVVQTVVRATPTDEINRERTERAVHMANERVIAFATALLAVVTAILAFYTFKLWNANKTLVQGAEATGKQQATDMRNSIAQATRAADAMHDVADATKANALLMQTMVSKQMRAYLAVDMGAPTCQDGNNRFAGAPVIVNNGFTPAKNVSYRAAAGILDTALSKDFKFDDSAVIIENDAALGPRQSFIVNVLVKERFEEAEVQAIMRGDRKRLYVWGTVTYEDVFGGTWETRFCHNFLFFERDGIKFLGWFNTTHNSIT